MNTIKDLLASVKCCISSEIYSKDLSVRYGGINRNIMYNAIIYRILYDMLSNSNGVTDSIYGIYEISSLFANGTDSTIYLNEQNKYIYFNETGMIIFITGESTYTYSMLNDEYFIGTDTVSNMTGNIIDEILTMNIITPDSELNIIASKISENSTCFTKTDVCNIYNFLNKTCLTC